MLAPVSQLLPTLPARILDVGAGTGRDAAWLAAQGHQVVAVEPVHELRRAGMALHPTGNIEWLDDRLPRLERLRRTSDKFDLILVIAVWQHLRREEQSASINTLARVAAAEGRLILSLRHGPGLPSRRCFPA